MGKSEQKRICIQSKCIVRDELRQQLDSKDKDIQLLAEKLNRRREAQIKAYADIKSLAEKLDEVADRFLHNTFVSGTEIITYQNKLKVLAKQYLKDKS